MVNATASFSAGFQVILLQQLHAQLALIDRAVIKQTRHKEAGQASHQDRLEDQQILGERKGQEHRRDRCA